MLQAVQVIHEEKIVHSDLKPANFVLVKGQLKLIDFGIANAIANDTTNIQRDHQIGTVNYMSPEAIELPEGRERLKLGRPSDVWSLGCILYQMVYGTPPFHHLDLYQKMRAIPDVRHVIDCQEFSVPPALRNGSDSPASKRRIEETKVRVPQSVIATMHRCLVRDPKERITIPELLEENWLTMRERTWLFLFLCVLRVCVRWVLMMAVVYSGTACAPARAEARTCGRRSPDQPALHAAAPAVRPPDGPRGQPHGRGPARRGRPAPGDRAQGRPGCV